MLHKPSNSVRLRVDVPIGTLDVKMSDAFDHGARKMPMRNQRPNMPYTELYFGFLVWRAIFKILGAIGAGIFVVLYFIVDAIAPDDAPTFIAGTVICLIGAGVLAVLYIVVAVLYHICVPKRPRTMAEIEKSLGWTPNPPPGVSWFRENGEKKQFDPATQTWS